jgi:hypothetical protein
MGRPRQTACQDKQDLKNPGSETEQSKERRISPSREVRFHASIFGHFAFDRNRPGWVISLPRGGRLIWDAVGRDVAVGGLAAA